MKSLSEAQPAVGLRQRARGRPAVGRREIARAGGIAAADLDELPLLVGAAPVVVLDDVRVVGGGAALYFEGLVAVARDEPHIAVRAVGQPPLLVGAVDVGPLDDRAAVGGGPVVDVQHLAGVAGLDAVVTAAGVDELPLLLVLVVPGPLGDAGAVAGRQVVDVQGLAAVAVDQHIRGVGVDGRRVGGLGPEEGGHEQQGRKDGEQASWANQGRMAKPHQKASLGAGWGDADEPRSGRSGSRDRDSLETFEDLSEPLTPQARNVGPSGQGLSPICPQTVPPGTPEVRDTARHSKGPCGERKLSKRHRAARRHFERFGRRAETFSAVSIDHSPSILQSPSLSDRP